MESSDTSSSDLSSTSSDSSLIRISQPAPMLNNSKMSFAPQRSESEVKMIEEAVSSLLNTFDQYRPHLIDTQYAYFCKYSTDFLNAELDKKARKANKHGVDNTNMSMVDTASVAGSMRSAPLRQFYPSNVPPAQNPRYARAPSVASSFVGDSTWQPGFEPLTQRYVLSGHSSGYSSGVPSYGAGFMNRAGFSNSVDPHNPHRQLHRQQPLGAISRKHEDDTLTQALEETVDISSSPEQVQKKPKNKPTADSQNRHARPKLPTPSTSSPLSDNSDSDYTDVQSKKIKVNTAVPKKLKGVTKLFDWQIKLIGKDLFVSGTTRDNSQVTSGAVMRYSHPSIVTTKGNFTFVGKPCFVDRTPAYIKSACSKGFPRMWKALSRRWFTDRQARRKSTPKKTPERKNTKSNSGTGNKIKGINSASKATSNDAGKAKASKSTPAKKSEKKPQKNGSSFSSQSDKENRTTRRRSKSMETLTHGKSYHTKSNVMSKKQKKPLPTEDDDESDDDSPVAAKQTKSKVKVVKSRSNPDVSSKKKQPDTADDESESDFDSPVAAKQTKSNVVKSRPNSDDKSDSDSPVAAKQAKPKVVRSRSNPDSESDSDETDDTVVESSVNNVKRAYQERGSDTSWDTPAKRTPTPKAQPNKAAKNNKSAHGISEPKTYRKETASAKPKDTAGATIKKLSNAKAKQPSNSNKSRPPGAKNDGGSKKPVDIFGDKPASREHATDAFSAIGGDDLYSIPGSRSMTPNTFVASIQPDAGTIGRYTPPLQNVVHLFSGNPSNKTNSSFGSPSSLNNSRDNPVSRRMAKDVEASKKGGKKKKKLPEFEVPGELEDLVKSLKNNNTVKTPNIVKKVFRNQHETDEDESVASDKDDSMIY